ncbi:MAG: DHH family phosphoesterase [Nanobdellota archaeon]
MKEERFRRLKEELDSCKNPLFLYDDDPDGLSSYLILRRYKGEGHGTFVKSVPRVGEMFLRQVEKHDPDKIFILDIPNIDEVFLEGINVPIVWVDHHEHESQPEYIVSINPHDEEYPENISTTEICYKAVEEDLWIAALGAIGDWTLPSYLPEFIKEYPDLIGEMPSSPSEALFDTKFSELITTISMVLKGDTNHGKRCVKKLLEIKSPYEIINRTSQQGDYIARKVKPMYEEYKALLDRALEQEEEDGIISFIYEAKNYSFSKEISNYLQHRNPDKVIIVGRKKNGEYKLSIRGQQINIPPKLEKALVDIDGYGGGHEHACGSCINAEHFDVFIEQLKDQVKK